MHLTEDLLFFTLLQLVVIVLAARAGNVVARKLRQPGAVGEIVAGLLLGPSLLGFLLPNLSGFLFNPITAAPIMVISQIGLILLMFQIGSDFEFGHLSSRRNRKAVIVVSASSIGFPLVFGVGLGYLSGPVLAPAVDTLTYSLFIGVALAITALPILGRILLEFDLNRSEVGVIAISVAAVNDMVGWILLAGISAYASAQFSPQQSGLQIAAILVVAACLWFFGRHFVNLLLARFPVVDGRITPNLMAICLALLFAFSVCTYVLGIFAIFGGFAAGMLFHRHQVFVEVWRRQVGQFVLVFFLPVFFTFTGLRTNILGLVTSSDWLWCALFLAVAVIGKIVGVYIAARLSGLSRSDSSILGTLMNTRALMELIVLNIGFDLGIIPQNVFTMLVVMAVVTTCMTAPLLRMILVRMGHLIPTDVEA